MFKKKIILDYEERILELNKEKDLLMKQNELLRTKLAAIDESINKTPSDCTIGRYCKLCMFGKCYHYGHEFVFVCGKGESCSNFTKRDSVEEVK